MKRSLRAIKTKRSCLGTFFGLAMVILASVLTGVATVRSVLDHYRAELPDVSTLTYYEPSLTTRIFASDGTLIGTLYRENRTWTHLDQVSPHLLEAVLAIEDSRFYEHRGVDPKGVLRAVASRASSDGGTQGASTITMQLARNLFLSPKQTLDRKLKEVLVALEVEKSFTKDEILELYLNQIYFGAGAYGVHSAADQYFGKRPKDLTAAEASLLAGLPQAPSDYSPFVDEAAAKARQKIVLDRMLEIEALTPEEYDQAWAEVQKQTYASRKKAEFTVLRVPYFTSYVIKQLYKQFDEEMLFQGGLNIYTTVDLSLQNKGEQIVKEAVARDRAALNVHQAAFVTVENGTGYIRAMVGGTGWQDEAQFNRAWQAERQPGSSFKTFVYATALECGYRADMSMLDAPLDINGWKPKNSTGRFSGNVSVDNAFRQSVNIIAVKLMQLTGPNRVIEVTRRLGVTGKMNPFYSLALGATDLTVLEMADAISTIPNSGIRIPASPIKLITDRDGNVVIDNRFPEKKDVLSESTASEMMKMMRGVVVSGTGGRAYLPNHETAGKTGTTDSYRDAWFVGFTRDYTTAVWCGNDDYSQMWRSFGGDLPASIWVEVTKHALRNVEESKLPITNPSKLGLLVCSESGVRVGPNCPTSTRKLVSPSEITRRFCSKHGAPSFDPSKAASEDDSDADKAEEQTPVEAAAEAESPVVEDTFAPIPTQIDFDFTPPSDSGGEAPAEPPPAPSEAIEPVAPVPVELPPPPAQQIELPPPPPEPVVIPLSPPDGGED